MSQFSDAIMESTGSSQPRVTYVGAVCQATSGTFYEVYHPGGTMTGSILLAPANPNRVDIVWVVVGSPVKMSFGAPAVPPAFSTVSNLSVGARPNLGVGWAYSGPIYGYWDGTATLSSSFICLTDLSGN